MPLTKDFTYQLGDSGLVLNDDSVSNAPFVDINKVSGLDSAPYRITKRDHEGLDGGFIDAEFETGRDIILEGTVYVPFGQSVDDYLDDLKANFAPSTTLVPFYFFTNDSGQRLVYVKPLGVQYDIDVARRIGSTPIKFSMYAEKPMIFSFSQVSGTMSVGATVFTGFGFNLGFNFGFGGTSSTTDGQFFNNTGNRDTPVILTLNGPLTNPVIYNDTVNKNLDFDIVLASGESLIIDTYYRTVYFNGTSNRRNALSNAGWFYLAPGQNFIKFRAEAGTGTLGFTFRPAWR